MHTVNGFSSPRGARIIVIVNSFFFCEAINDKRTSSGRTSTDKSIFMTHKLMPTTFLLRHRWAMDIIEKSHDVKMSDLLNGEYDSRIYLIIGYKVCDTQTPTSRAASCLRHFRVTITVVTKSQRCNIFSRPLAVVRKL